MLIAIATDQGFVPLRKAWMRNAARHLDDMERKYRRGATICRIIRLTCRFINLRAGQSPRGKDSTESEEVHAWEASNARLSRQPALRSNIHAACG